MEWIVAGGVMIIIVLHQIWQGYRQETSPSYDLIDDGHGIKQPICKKCRMRLVTVSRDTGSGLAGLLALLLVIVGIVLFIINWLAGGIVMILALMINSAGKGTETALTCPICGQDARIID